MMFLMKLPLQTGYTILSEGWSCPTMPNDDEVDIVLDSSRLVHVVIRLIEALGESMPFRRHNMLSLRHVE